MVLVLIKELSTFEKYDHCLIRQWLNQIRLGMHVWNQQNVTIWVLLPF